MSLGAGSLRRRQVLAALALGVVACNKKDRCSTCGMVLPGQSRWLSELAIRGKTMQRFDTPKCAFRAWRKAGAPKAKLFFLEYYSQIRSEASELKFALGSDVVGPMGADLVPVAKKSAAQFGKEHKAKQLLQLSEITDGVLGKI